MTTATCKEQFPSHPLSLRKNDCGLPVVDVMLAGYGYGGLGCFCCIAVLLRHEAWDAD